MNLFLMECGKIIRRPLLWFWFAAIAGFMIFYLYISTIGNESCVVDGVRYTGLEAIQKDREIAKQWEGVLTMEKLHAILSAYGPALNGFNDLPSSRGGNWVSRFATDYLTDYPQGGNGELLSEEALAWKAEVLEAYKPWFGYTGKYEIMLLEGSIMSSFGIAVLIIIALSPVFSEEYSLKTASLLLSSAHGRGKDIAARIAASLTLSILLCLAVNGMILAAAAALYGVDGFQAGASLFGNISMDFYGKTFGQVYFQSFAWAILGMMLLASITLFFSARCKTPFLTVIWSLVVYVSGFFLLNGLSQLLRPSVPAKLCYIAGKWSPLYLPVTFGWGQLSWEMPAKLIYVLAVTVICFAAARRLYRRYEG